MQLRWPFSRQPKLVPERLDPHTAYSLWASSYPPQPHNPLMKVEQAAMLELLPAVQGLSVLDAGCGTGRYLKELHARGANTVGIDFSDAMLSRARQFAARIARADLRALPLVARSLDLVVCGLALGDVEELELVLKQFARVLRPGCHVIYSVVHPAGAAAGWSRTFESKGRQWAIESHWHSLERHRAACAAAGFTIDDWREPILGGLPDGRVALVVKAHTSVERP